MKYPVSAPIVGPWLYRRSVKELAHRARQGDVAAVQNLTDIFCTSREVAVRDITRTALSNLVSHQAIDRFCKETIERNDEELYTIATDSNYLPSDTGLQAIFLFITGQQQRYLQCDPLPNRPLLASGYAKATHRQRHYIRNTAKKSGHCNILTAALRENAHSGNAISWTEEEWEIVIPGLIQDKAWGVLWQYIVNAPLHLSITALSAMKAAEWRPAGDDVVFWQGITRNLPREWCCPVPHDTLSIPLRNPDSQPLHLTFSCDGTLLAAVCADGSLLLWNMHAGVLVFRLPADLDTITGITFSADHTRLLCAGINGSLQCRDTVTGTLLWSVGSGELTPLQFACLHNGSAVVFPGIGAHIRIVKMADGQEEDISGGNEAPATCCILSHDDRFCAVGYSDGTVGIWNLQIKQVTHTLEGQGNPVRSLTFCEGDNEILVMYDQNQPITWDITSKKRIRTYTGNTGQLGLHAITLDGSSFVIEGDDRILRIWLSGNSTPVAEIPLYNHPLGACSISADGRVLATGCTDGTLRTYLMNEGAVLYEKKAHKQGITAIALTSSGERLASTGWDGTVKLWDSVSGELVRTLLQPCGGVTCITANPEGSSIYAGYTNGTVRNIPCKTGEFNQTLDMYTSTIRAIAINHGGTLLACAGGDPSLRVWNVKTGGLVASIEGLKKTQRSLAFSHDGKTLISGGWDGRVRFWSIPEGLLLKTLIGHSSIITALVISPDGTMLASGSNDRSIRLWTIGDGKCVLVREDSRSEVSALALSPDGQLLAFAGADSVIHICSMPNGTPAPAIPALPGKIKALAFASEGRLLVAGFDTGTVAVFSCAGRNLMRTMTPHTGAVTGIVVLPGGESVMTSGLDGQVRHENLPWTRSMAGTGLDDIPLVARYERTSTQPDARAQWAFLHGMLATRFSNDIELCTGVNDSSLYDIQIVG
jgi:WD40 repeat protein